MHAIQRHSGMVDFLPGGIMIDHVCWQGQPTACVAVMLPPAQLKALGIERGPGLEPERALRLGLTDSHVADLVRRLHAQVTDGLPLGALYVEALSLTLASYVYERYGAERMAKPPSGPGLSLSHRERLVALIEERMAEPLHLSELAAEVGYSQDHFLRLFRHSFGISPHRYLIVRRIERAKSMLNDDDCSLVEVAFACGFSSQAHFSSTFKQHAGITPGRYRNGGRAESGSVAGRWSRATGLESARERGEPRQEKATDGAKIPSNDVVLMERCPATAASRVAARAWR